MPLTDTTMHGGNLPSFDRRFGVWEEHRCAAALVAAHTVQPVDHRVAFRLLLVTRRQPDQVAHVAAEDFAREGFILRAVGRGLVGVQPLALRHDPLLLLLTGVWSCGRVGPFGLCWFSASGRDRGEKQRRQCGGNQLFYQMMVVLKIISATARPAPSPRVLETTGPSLRWS